MATSSWVCGIHPLAAMLVGGSTTRRCSILSRRTSAFRIRRHASARRLMGMAPLGTAAVTRSLACVCHCSLFPATDLPCANRCFHAPTFALRPTRLRRAGHPTTAVDSAALVASAAVPASPVVAAIPGGRSQPSIRHFPPRPCLTLRRPPVAHNQGCPTSVLTTSCSAYQIPADLSTALVSCAAALVRWAAWLHSHHLFASRAPPLRPAFRTGVQMVLPRSCKPHRSASASTIPSVPLVALVTPTCTTRSHCTTQ